MKEKKILIIDDNRETCLEIRAYFDTCYKICFVNDIVTAKDQLNINSDFFCVLIDLKLDDKSELGGVEIVKHIIENQIKTNMVIDNLSSSITNSAVRRKMLIGVRKKRRSWGKPY